jgi:hypothetical protein
MPMRGADTHTKFCHNVQADAFFVRKLNFGFFRSRSWEAPPETVRIPGNPFFLQKNGSRTLPKKLPVCRLPLVAVFLQHGIHEDGPIAAQDTARESVYKKRAIGRDAHAFLLICETFHYRRMSPTLMRAIHG